MSEKRWIPDTCLCVLIFDDAALTFVRFEARCREHTALDGQRLFDGVVTHNASYNTQFNPPPSPTEEQRRTETARIKAMRDAEKERIRSLGTPETR